MNVPKSGTLVAKNTLYNILGYGLPLVFALVLIPPLIQHLGTERFGILSLIWIIIGYSSFFDFGIGRSLTKIVAEKLGQNNLHEIPALFWNSLYIMFATSLIISLTFFIITPYLVDNVFNITQEYRKETTSSFYILAISIPVVISTTGVRGILEAYQKFGIINFVRTILGIFTFLGPLLVVSIKNDLFWIVSVLLFIRLIVWFVYLFQIFKTNSEIKNKAGLKFNYKVFKPILKFSVWITIANIVGPTLLYSDRFLIASLDSTTAVTYYATPYEIVTKLLLLPTALAAVIFPLFSATYFSDPIFSNKIFIKSVKLLFIILFPITLLISNFSYDLIYLWLGQQFADNSTLVLQLLTFGVLMNSIAFIPFNYLQGIGVPHIPAVINLVELPFYLVAMWFAITIWGINGAAFIWTIRILIDTFILFFITNRRFDLKLEYKFVFFFIICILLNVLILLIKSYFIFNMLLVIILIITFIYVSWKRILSEEDKSFIYSKLLFIKK